jgi:hypothetical protein
MSASRLQKKNVAFNRWNAFYFKGFQVAPKHLEWGIPVFSRRPA